MTKLEGLNEDFRDLVASFADCQVDFVIVGAFALAFHGGPARQRRHRSVRAPGT